MTVLDFHYCYFFFPFKQEKNILSWHFVIGEKSDKIFLSEMKQRIPNTSPEVK